MARKWHNETLRLRHPQEQQPVPVVADPAMATATAADGRLLPILILDTTSRPDIEVAFRAHEQQSPGRVVSRWAKPRMPESIGLLLQLEEPAACTVYLEFHIPTRGGVVDQIIRCQSLYLQAGRPGDRLISTLNHTRVLVEVPSSEFRVEWDRLFHKAMEREYQRRGARRSEAKRRAADFIRDTRRIMALRMPNR